MFVFERSMDKYGGDSQWETPVPISNTEVKPLNADDSVKAKIGSCRTEMKPRYLKQMSGFSFCFVVFSIGV